MIPQDTLSGWQLDETSATAYENELVPRLFDPWAVDLIEVLALETGQRVLDVACGTGAVARHAVARVGPEGEVFAVDVSPAMLSVARRVAAGTTPPITFQEADAAKLPLSDGSVDAVACQQGLQFFPDRTAALDQMRRVAKPGGRLAVSTCRGLDHQPGYRKLADVLTRHVGVHAAEITASPYAFGEPAELRAALGESGWRDPKVEIRLTDVRFDTPERFLVAETSSSPLGLLVDQLDDDVRADLLADLTAELRPHMDDNGVVFPFETLVATATR